MEGREKKDRQTDARRTVGRMRRTGVGGFQRGERLQAVEPECAGMGGGRPPGDPQALEGLHWRPRKGQLQRFPEAQPPPVA